MSLEIREFSHMQETLNAKLLYSVRLRSGLKVLKLFAGSTQVNMKFQLLINTKMLKNKGFICFQSLSSY